jgi:delta-1-pyrroline-5-carboxylate synthetase
MTPREQAVAARAAAQTLRGLSTAARARLLRRVASTLEAEASTILAANEQDIRRGAATLSDALMARLRLSPRKLESLADGIRDLSEMEEPIGRILRKTELAPNLTLQQVTSPLGVLLVIFESRPDALPQVASLALKSGNGLILKGGREAAETNRVLHELIAGALRPDVSPHAIGLVQTREEVGDLLALDDVIDLVIPRGSNAMVRQIQQNTRIPVLGHADGICHVYIDAAADPSMALEIALDAKTDYPAACNAMETLLVHRDFEGLEGVLEGLRRAGVTLHQGPETDFRTEYGDLACSVRVVAGLEEAIAHIHAFGSGHTDAIITADRALAQAFLDRVDSACVFHNASTRFADGYRFGLGAEVGISTSRIHARGPVGVDGLLTTRWQLFGSGDTAGPFSSGERTFTHRPQD